MVNKINNNKTSIITPKIKYVVVTALSSIFCIAPNSDILRVALSSAVKVFNRDNTKIWLTSTPVKAPKGLKDCEKLSLLVADSGSPKEYTYAFVAVSSTDNPANSTNIANRYVAKLSGELILFTSIAG